jgi:hypothetical protein
MNGPVLIPICSWFLTALSDFFNSLLGGVMSKRAKREKTETLALPVAGKVTVVVIAIAALGTVCYRTRRAFNRCGNSLRVRFCFRHRHHQLLPQLALQFRLQLPLPRLRLKFRKPLTFPEDLFGRSLTTSATRRQAPSSSIPETHFFILS